MRAITLTQPWATLVAIGAKQIETRSWKTPYRGQLAIHAAKGWTKDDVALFFEEPFRSTLGAAGYKLYSLLPRGAVVATCRLVSVRPTGLAQFPAAWLPAKDSLERFFGDFSPGRYGWFLEDVRPLPAPIPARGSLGLWEWTAPEGVLA